MSGFPVSQPNTHFERVHEVWLARSEAPAAEWERDLFFPLLRENLLPFVSAVADVADEQHQEGCDRNRFIG